MTTATYTKIAKKVESEDCRYSLGFRRLISIPRAARSKVEIAAMLQTGSTNNCEFLRDFFGGMSDSEFKIWVLSN